MNRMQADVLSFHRKFNFPAPDSVELPDQPTLGFRCRLVREEVEELIQAIVDQDLPAIAQEAMDLLYVTLGALVECGLDVDDFWPVVHSANMRKEPNPGGKPTKPEGWIKPDFKEIVATQG